MARENTTKFLSNKQETRVAKQLKAKKVIGSGCIVGMKGDVRSDLLLIECKTTKSLFYTLKIDVWEKIRREAIRDSLRIPVMCIEINKNSFAVFSLNSFLPIEKVYTDRFEKVETKHKSFRLEKEIKCDTVISIQNHKLVVMRWEEFLFMFKKYEEEVESWG